MALFDNSNFEVTICTLTAEMLENLGDILDIFVGDETGFQLIEHSSVPKDSPGIVFRNVKERTRIGCILFLDPMKVDKMVKLMYFIVNRNAAVPPPEKKLPEIGSNFVGESNNCAKKRETVKKETSSRKPRFSWSDEYSKKFQEIVDRIGLHRASPKEILESLELEIPGLSRNQVASHLQKVRKRQARKPLDQNVKQEPVDFSTVTDPQADPDLTHFWFPNGSVNHGSYNYSPPRFSQLPCSQTALIDSPMNHSSASCSHFPMNGDFNIPPLTTWIEHDSQYASSSATSAQHTRVPIEQSNTSFVGNGVNPQFASSSGDQRLETMTQPCFFPGLSVEETLSRIYCARKRPSTPFQNVQSFRSSQPQNLPLNINGFHPNYFASNGVMEQFPYSSENSIAGNNISNGGNLWLLDSDLHNLKTFQ